MVDERPKLAASEIEAVLRAALQKLPSLRGTKAVRIRPYSGLKSFTWEVDMTHSTGQREARVASSAPPRRHPQAGGGGLRSRSYRCCTGSTSGSIRRRRPSASQARRPQRQGRAAAALRGN